MADAAPDTEPRKGTRQSRRRPSGRKQPRRPPGQPVNDGLFSTRPPADGPPPGGPTLSPLDEELPEDGEGTDEEERDEEDDQGRRQRRDEEGKDKEEGEKEGEEKEGEEERRDEGEEKPEEEGEREPREEPQEREPGGERPEGRAPERPPSPRTPGGAAGEAGGAAEGLGAGAEAGAAGAEATSAAAGGAGTTAAGGAGAAATGAGAAGAGAAGAGAAGAAGAAGTAAAGAAGTAAAGAAAGTAAAGAGAAAAAGAGTAPIWIPIVIIIAVVLLLLIILVIIISFAGEGLGGRTTGIPGDGQRERDLTVTNGEILDQTILGRGQGAQGTFPPIPAGAGTRAAQIVQLAQAEVGNCEQPLGSNTGPRIRTYKRGAGDSLPWCASFSTYVLKNAGVPIGHERAAKGTMRYYQNNGGGGFRWIPKGNGPPAPGDIFVRDRCPPGRQCANGHIGIVTSVDQSKGTYTTVEGNIGRGCVETRTYNLARANVIGFGRYTGR